MKRVPMWTGWKAWGLHALLLAGALVQPLTAQTAGSIRGVVRNTATGQVVPDIAVRLVEVGREAQTGVSGVFRFPGLPPGNHTVVIAVPGFGAFQRAVSVLSAQESEIEIRLDPQPFELSAVLASADRSFSAASSRTIRALDLAVRPIRSAQDLLRLVPGLVTAQHAGGGKAEQIFLRGFDADHGTDVAIAVDGVPVNMVSHGHGQGYADLHFLIPDVVERLDVFKGPYRAEAGNFATAGAVSFTTRDHLDSNIVRAETGAFGTAALTTLFQIPTAGEHQGAYLAGQFYRTDGPFAAQQEFGRFNLFGKFHTHLSEDTRLSVAASGFSSAWDASGQIPQRAVAAGQIDRFGAIDDQEGGTTGRQDLSLIYEAGDASDRFRLHGFVTRYNFKLFSNFSFFMVDPERGDMIEQTDRRQMHGLNGSYRFRHALGTGRDAAVTLGGGYRADDIDVTLWHSPSRIRATGLVDAGIAERNLHLWAQEEVQLSRRVRMQLGVRWDYFTFDVDDRLERDSGDRPHASGYAQQAILSPKASLVVSPARNLDVYLNAGAGFHSNDAREIVIGQRTEDLRRSYRRQGLGDREIERLLTAQNLDPAHDVRGTPPRAVGGEVGVRARAFSRLNVAAAAWFIDVEREFVYVGDGGLTELRGRSRRHGLDLEARLGLADWLSADADVGLSRARLRDEPAGSDAIPLAPRVTWTGGFNAIRDRWDASLRYVHIGDRPANETGSVTARGFTVFNVVAGIRRGPVRIGATLENLFDTEWNEAQFDTESRLRGEARPVSELHFTPGNPRNLRVGLTLLF